jgi:hypothetical protein
MALPGSNRPAPRQKRANVEGLIQVCIDLRQKLGAGIALKGVFREENVVEKRLPKDR